MTILFRTTPHHQHFKQLVSELDAELWIRYPAIQQNYDVIPNYPPYTNMAESMCMAKELASVPLV